jgi:Sec-independent protein translocase protein TatA
MTPYLGLLGLGATEVALVVLAYVLLFGVDEAPELARKAGRAQARFSRWKAEFDREMEAARLDAEGSFEMQREEQMRNQDPGYVESVRLEEAAEALGIDPSDRTEEELRAAIREAVGDDSLPSQ